MKIEELKELQASGQYHHATYRNHGTLWEGLWIYRRDENGFQGYTVAGCFNVCDRSNLDIAMELCSNVSVGAYGNG